MIIVLRVFNRTIFGVPRLLFHKWKCPQIPRFHRHTALRFRDVLARTHSLSTENDWTILDQHYDPNSYLAHKSTADEILRDLPDVTDVVVATGTGATAQGLREFLPDSVTVHARRTQSGTVDGLTDVSLYNNFCDVGELEGYMTEGYFTIPDAEKGREELREKGIHAGLSSGASYWLAQQVGGGFVFAAGKGDFCGHQLGSQLLAGAASRIEAGLSSGASYWLAQQVGGGVYVRCGKRGFSRASAREPVTGWRSK